jgi:hypothetical protein
MINDVWVIGDADRPHPFPDATKCRWRASLSGDDIKLLDQ